MELKDIIDMKETNLYFFVRKDQKWIIDRVNTNFLRVIDLETQNYINAVTTKQWRLPNAGFIKIPITKENEYLKNENLLIYEGCFLRTITAREAYMLMGFEEEDYFKAFNCFKELGLSDIRAWILLYRQAGNSIEVNTLVKVMERMGGRHYGKLKTNKKL